VKKILVLSDTHLIYFSPGIPEPVKHELSLCDMLIHAGDFTGVNLYHDLNAMTELIAVRGNSDGIEISKLLPSSREFSIEKIKFGLLHGNGSGDTTMKYANSIFRNCDIVIFGHSHLPVNQTVNGVLMFNPGSPTDPRRAPGPS
jgi:hypothetical protein